MNGTSEDGDRKQRKGQRTLTEKRTNNFKYMHLKEDRPLLSKRRTQEYWKVVAGVVVLHRQPLPSVWVVETSPTPPHPTTPNIITISLVNSLPFCIIDHSFFMKLFTVPPHSHWDVCSPSNPPCRVKTIPTSTNA